MRDLLAEIPGRTDGLADDLVQRRDHAPAHLVEEVAGGCRIADTNDNGHLVHRWWCPVVQGRLQYAQLEDAPFLCAAGRFEPCPDAVERKLQLRARPFRVKGLVRSRDGGHAPMFRRSAFRVLACFVAADKIDPVSLERGLNQIPEAPTALGGAGEDVPPQDHVGEESLRDLRCALGAVPARPEPRFHRCAIADKHPAEAVLARRDAWRARIGDHVPVSGLKFRTQLNAMRVLA